MALLAQEHAHSGQPRLPDRPSALGESSHVPTPTSQEPHQPALLLLPPPPPPQLPGPPPLPTQHEPRSKDREHHRQHRESRERKEGHREQAREKGHSGSGSGTGSGHPSSSHQQRSSRESGTHRRAASREEKGKSGSQHHYTSFTPDSKDNRLKRPSTFLCRIHFSNGFPEPASQPKLIPLKSDPLRYTGLKRSSLEQGYKHKVHLDADLGIPLDLLDLRPYTAPPASERPALAPEDEALLLDPDSSAATSGVPGTPSGNSMALGRSPGAGRSRHTFGVTAGPRAGLLRQKPSVEGLNWLMSTQYIAPLTAEDARAKKTSLTEQEVKMLALQLELADDQQQLSTREGRLHYIQESFRLAQEPPVHPADPKLKPVAVLPLLPYLERESERFLHVVFDEEPLRDSKKHSALSPQARGELESKAVMKQYKTTAVPGEAAKPFLAYMVPAAWTSVQEVDEALEEGLDVPYTWLREYYYQLQKDKGDHDKESFVFCFGEDCVKYLKIHRRMNLNKLKKLSVGSSQHQEEDASPSIPVPSSIHVTKLVDNQASIKKQRVV